MKVIFDPRAKADYAQASRYYLNISRELARAFLQEVEVGVNRIEAFPLAWPIIEDNIRRLTLNRFPFAIYYMVDTDVIEIYAVLHMKRHPGHWTSRTPGD